MTLWNSSRLTLAAAVFCPMSSGLASAQDADTQDAGLVVVTDADRSSADVNGDLIAHFRTLSVQTSFEGFDAAPLLNVGIQSNSSFVIPGSNAKFMTYWNYGHWIEKAEIIVFAMATLESPEPLAVLPVSGNSANWQVPADLAGEEIGYFLRVTDHNGRSDETIIKSFTVANPQTEMDETPFDALSIYGTDATVSRNIDVDGGAISVSSQNTIEQGAKDIRVFGEPVLLDPDGDFAVQRVLPAGTHSVDISYVRPDGATIELSRDVTIPDSDLFVVAIGDLTIGTRSDGARELIEAAGEDFDKSFINGRAAFYLKGKIKGEYLITAALDTTEDNIDNLFSNLNDKDPESLLRRLDADRFYPVYGDDSTYYEDAPTQGRFYVRVERDENHVVWGNFVTNITHTEFAQIDRGLYGAKAEYNSEAITDKGERKRRATIFLADPGTLPAREEFRATGGSVYFLQNQDLTIGSERLRVEYRDEDSGLVVETVDLDPYQDYDIDYIQGRVLLNRPLTSTRLGSQIVRDGTLSGNQAFLVARYEFTPGFDDIDGFTAGGRGEAWVGDDLRVGVTLQNEETGDADQTLIAGDATWRISDRSYLKAELAQTDGAGFNETASIDGGFSFDELVSSGSDSARAVRVEGAADFTEIREAFEPGRIGGYYEHLEAGFSGVGRLTRNDTERYGANIEFQLADPVTISAKWDSVSIDQEIDEDTVEVDTRIDVSETFNLGVGVRHNDIAGPGAFQTGDRTDVGVEARYTRNANQTFYGFGQTTVSARDGRDKADRLGVGGDFRFYDRYTIGGEVSGGTNGAGAQIQLGYKVREGEEYYLGYALDAERRLAGIDGGDFLSSSQNTLTLGGRRRFNSYVSVYGEERASFGDTSGITHAYGIDLTPFEKWSIGASFEIGDVEQENILIEREAYAVNVGYTDDDLAFGSAFEWLQDDNNGVQRDTWLFRSNLGVRVSPDWRAILKFNKAESESSNGAFFNGDFTEAQIAGAYRPTANDRFNGLVRYAFYEDLPSSEQVSNSGQTGLPAQRSHIFSADGNYQISDWLTLGGKLGYRYGEISLSRLADDFVDSEALLWVARADVHVVRNWDALLELRGLDVDLAGDNEFGALAAIYRHLGDHAKVGVGYNFTNFSDDLRDLSFNDDGFFLNIITKY